MTLTELDAIEKLARDPKSAAFHDLMARQTIPLVKAVREAWQDRDAARAVLQNIAEDDCAYGDNCPSNAGTRHGTCTACTARTALGEAQHG